jgi:hypothetical protein
MICKAFPLLLCMVALISVQAVKTMHKENG